MAIRCVYTASYNSHESNDYVIYQIADAERAEHESGNERVLGIQQRVIDRASSCRVSSGSSLLSGLFDMENGAGKARASSWRADAASEAPVVPLFRDTAAYFCPAESMPMVFLLRFRSDS